MAPVAAAFHGHPSDALRVVGITGTNGKTTVAYLVQAILEAHGWPTGVIGTLSGARTTPEAPLLQAELAGFRDEGRRAVAMEVSSHALVQHRVDAVHFAVAVFTNLSQDHLDYHGSMDAYFEAKAQLFRAERAEVAVINADDPAGRMLLERGGVRTVAYSLADAVDLEVGREGSTFRWEGVPVSLLLGGRFNVANALAAATAARELDVPAEAVAAGLAAVRGVPGRFERIEAGQPFTVVVDYAHTPDGLEQALRSAREMAGDGRVVVVFGCGGDRDRSKRPRMGEVATRLADMAVLTSDNPRSEDPQAIIDEVRAGVTRTDVLVVEPDRRAAIEGALAEAEAGDVVLVAGKGHETGQEQAGRVEPFDDRDVAREALAHAVGGGGPW
jgi:UDP-N-acetylmuramoyl-L-alanyl-D-glutamate--2,6-diaminopimelate ligase